MTDRDVRERRADGFEARLLPMLLKALEERDSPRIPRRPTSPRIVRRTIGVAVAAAFLVVATTVLVASQNAIEVRATDAIDDPAEVTQDLRDAGIEARILIVPVPPSAAGTWWSLSFSPGTQVDDLAWAKLKAQVGVGVAGLPEEIRDRGRGVFHHEVLELPRNLGGPVTLSVGRAERPGEAEAPMDNELAPNGAFWCLDLHTMPADRAGRLLEDMGYEVVWVYQTFEGPGGEGRQVDTPPQGSGITTAFFRAPDVVDIRLAPEADVERLRVQAGTPTQGSNVPAWAPACEDSATT